MPRFSSGHAPGHLRECFGSAVNAFAHWNDDEPEPTVEYEVNFIPRFITISKACRLVWNCTDVLPGLLTKQLEDVGIAIERRTYAAAAHAMLEKIKFSVAQ